MDNKPLKLLPLIFLIYTFVLINCVHALEYKRQTKVINLPITNFVSDVVETKNGYMWFATDAGLSAYDGKRYKQYQDIDDKYFPSDSIFDLSLSATDIIWIGAQYGLASFDYKTQAFISYNYTLNNEVIALEIRQLKLLNDELIVINTFNQGLFLFDIKNKVYIKGIFNKILPMQDDQQVNIIDIEPYNNGFLILTNKQGLSYIETSPKPIGNNSLTLNNIIINNLIFNDLTNIGLTNKHIWIAEKTRLTQLDKKTLKIIKQIELPKSIINDSNSYAITDILESKESGLLLSTNNNGMLIYEDGVVSQDISYQLNTASLSDNKILRLFADSHNTIWVIGKGNSVDNVIEDSQAISVLLPISKLDLKALKPYSVNAIYREGKKLWLGTDQGIIVNNNYNEETGYVELNKNTPHRNINVLSINRFHNDYFMTSSHGKLWLLNDKGKVIREIPLKYKQSQPKKIEFVA